MDAYYLYSNLPEVLSQEEFWKYMEEYKNGDLEAKKILIEHNIRFVVYLIKENFSYLPFEMEDLLSIGMIGLIKSIESFDMNKKTFFLSYAKTCIFNEILMYIRINKKHLGIISLNTSMDINDDGKKVLLEDTIEDENIHFIEDYEKKELLEKIQEVIFYLPEKERMLIIMNFGLFGNLCYSQKAIAEQLGVTPSCVCKMIKKALKKLKILCEEAETLDAYNQKRK